MPLEIVALLLNSFLCHAHRPGASDNSQPLLIDPRGRQISVWLRRGNSNVHPFLSSLMQTNPTDREGGAVGQNISHGGSDAVDVSSAPDTNTASSPNANTEADGASKDCGIDASQWDESKDKDCIQEAAAELKANPQVLVFKYCHNVWDPKCFISSPLKFEECHDAFREGVWSMRAPAMTMEEAKSKFGESIAMYKLAADAISKDDSEGEENFKDILLELQEGRKDEEFDNPMLCYILRALAPQRLWTKDVLKLGMDEGPADKEKKGDLEQTVQFHSPLHDAIRETGKRYHYRPLLVGVRIKTDMEDLFNKIQDMNAMFLLSQPNIHILPPFCREDWRSAPAECKKKAKELALQIPVFALAKSGIPGGTAFLDAMPTKENINTLYQRERDKCLLNDPEIHDAYSTGLEREAKAQGRVFTTAIGSLHDREDLKGKLDLGGMHEGGTVYEEQEKALRDAGLENELSQLIEEDLGRWNEFIEKMEPSIKEKGLDIQPGDIVTQKSLDEVTKALDKTREDLEDERLIRYPYAPNYRPILRQLPDADARNDPKAVASAMKKTFDPNEFDKMSTIEVMIIFFLAAPSVWRDDAVWKLFIDEVGLPTLESIAGYVRAVFLLTGARVQAIDREEYKKILPYAEAGAEIPADDQHTLRAAFNASTAKGLTQGDVPAPPPAKGYVCNALTPLKFCLEEGSGILEFECRETTLIAKTADRREFIGDLANQDEAEIMETGPFTIKLDERGYSLGGALEDGYLKDKEITLRGPTDEKPEGEDWKYKQCTE